MILVIGATGGVGRHVVSQLLDAGAAIRALARNPEAAALALPDGAQFVRGDLTNPDTLDAALDGVESVFLMWPFLTSEGAPVVMDAIRKQARRIVFLSSSGVRDDVERQAEPISQFHAEIEDAIAKSALEWTFLRSGGFATNALWWAPQIRTGSAVRWPYGAAARSPIHERDIAAVAVRALTEDGHVGAKYPLSGPESVTHAEQVSIIGEAIGRPVHFEEIPPEAGRGQLLGFLPPNVVDGVLDIWAGMVTEPEPVLRTVEEITGTPGRTFREWAADHADDFAEPVSR